MSLSLFAQQAPNYELASLFSQKRISQMVFSTSVTPNWFKNSDRFWYQYQTPAGVNYYIVNPETGVKSEIFDLDRLAMEITEITRDPFDAKHLPIQGLKLQDDKVFRFDIASTQEEPDTVANKKNKGGKPKMKKKVFHFEYDFATRQLSQYKPEENEYPRWAGVSPDGEIGVYAKNSNLYWMDRENMKKAAKDEKDSTIVEHKLTTDGIRQHGFGVSSYSGNTETDTTRRSMAGVIWSPDSKHFAAVKTDMRKIKELWVINSLSNPRPTLETYKYQMPGEPGPTEELYVFSMPDGQSKKIMVNQFKDQTIDIETAPRMKADMNGKYYSRKWLGDNNSFYMTRSSRDLHRIDFCRVDVNSDSTKTIVSERMNTYIELRQTRLINNGKQFIHWSERNGWANIYLYNADGTLVRNLTDGAYHVEDVLAVNEKEGYVLFSACGVNKNENPYQMHVFRVSLAGGPVRQLDMDDMNVDAVASENGKYFVANCSRVDYAPESYIVNAATGKRSELDKADLSLLYAAGYKMPERFKVKAADGITDLYGAMYKPFDFDSTKVYPIIDYVYPGPQVEGNNIAWTKGMLRTDRLAQVGFIVITVGNRGGHPNRSKWYHNYGYGNLRDYGLEDQKYAIQQLASKNSFIDVERVGIHGHSGGGFMSTAAILTYPDFFKAAVSCAGNHDNRIYNRWWSETHHGVKEVVEKGDTSFVYHIETNPQLAKNLKGHLMLVHGDIDNNVHPGNTIRVVDALIKANKRFDMLILPGQRHGFGDMNEYFFYRLADYFSEWLLGNSNRSQVDVRQLNND